MPPKKKTGNELLAQGSSQATGGQVLTTAQTTIQTTHITQIAHPQPSVEPRSATIETRRPEDLVEQPTTQVEVLTMNTSAPNTQPPHQYQAIENQEDQQQDSEEETKAVIEDEVTRIH
jgi:hypothetical protein